MADNGKARRGTGKVAVVTGACGGIGSALCEALAAEGFSLLLSARPGSSAELSANASALSLEFGVRAEARVCSLGSDASVRALADEAAVLFGRVDAVVCAHGAMPGEESVRSSWEALAGLAEANFVSAARVLETFVPLARPGAVLAAFGSPSGMRGRASNHAYGATKAALSCYLSGLGHRLAGSGIRVVELVPGLTRTPMTSGFDRSGPLWSDAERVAALAVDALCSAGCGRRFLPWFWGPLSWVFALMPCWLLAKTKV